MCNIIFNGPGRDTVPQWLLPFLQALYQNAGTSGTEQLLSLSRIPEGQHILFLQHQPPLRQEILVAGHGGVNQTLRAHRIKQAVTLSPL